MADSIFDLDEFKPLQAAWMARQQELAARASYYDGSVYSGTQKMLGWLFPRVGRAIKPLYLPLARAVDVDAGIIPGGWAFDEDAPEAWEQARSQVWAWSRWATSGVLYVHYGAVYGVSGLKVCDLREEKQILIVPVDPTCFMLTMAHSYNSVPAMALWIETRVGADGAEYEYAEVITPTMVRTFRNGKLFGYDQREPEYQNPNGFVPLVEVRHMEVGAKLGECTYQKAIPLLDEVNSLASQLAEIIRKNSDPQWAVMGAQGDDLKHSSDKIWFMPAGADVKILVPGIDVAGVLEFVREIRDQVFSSLPELAFDELRKKDQIATATLELQLMELVLKVKRCRPNYDDGLVQALRMAGRMAQSMEIGDLAALDEASLTFDQERPVLPLDPVTEMQLEMQALELEQARAVMMPEGGGRAGRDGGPPVP